MIEDKGRIADSSELSFSVHQHEVVLRIDQETFRVAPIIHFVIARQHDIPYGIYMRLLREAPEHLMNRLNDRLKESSKEYMLNLTNGVVYRFSVRS